MDLPPLLMEMILINLPCSLCFLVQKCSASLSAVFHLLIAGSFSESEADPFHGFAAHGRSPYHLSTPLNPFEPHRAASAPFSDVERLKTRIEINPIVTHCEV